MNHTHTLRRGGILASICLLGTLAAAPQVSAQVMINEILADPARDWDGDGVLDSRDDEWVEVVNRGTADVDLSTYWIRDEAASAPRLQLDGILAAGAVAVFYGSDALAWQEANDLGSGGLSLNNGGDTVVLLQTVPGSDPVAVEPVDTVAYPAHAVLDDRSCGWDTMGTEWVLFDGLNPYGGSLDPVGTGCPPTPGAVNLCGGEVSAERVNFGSAKARYR